MKRHEEEGQAAKEQAQTGGGDGGATAGEVVDVRVPEMGESVSEGTVLDWLVKVGDVVEKDQGLVEISTDKGMKLRISKSPQQRGTVVAAPIAAPLQPPAIPPMIAPSTAPPPTFLALSAPRLFPCTL